MNTWNEPFDRNAGTPTQKMERVMQIRTKARQHIAECYGTHKPFNIDLLIRVKITKINFAAD